MRKEKLDYPLGHTLTRIGNPDVILSSVMVVRMMLPECKGAVTLARSADPNC